MAPTRNTVATLQAAKDAKTPIVCLTAYTTPMARLLDPHCDLLLVGDSLGMVLYGMDSTLAVTLDMMKNHGAAVVRGSQKACVVVDMPFGSYQESPLQAFKNAAEIMQATGCTAVKLEGGQTMADTVRFLVDRGIPVMGHIGLMPQHVHALGGFRAQGRSEEHADRILRDAIALTQAGVFGIVLEAIPEPLAVKITQRISVPTIGIGASAQCDGQVLVCDDMLGLFSDFTPKFVKRYADTASVVSQAARQFSEEVRSRTFPTSQHCFQPLTSK